MKLKKFFSWILFLTLCFSFSSSAVAQTTAPIQILSKDVSYLEDGSYFETTIYENDNIITRASKTKTGTKTTSYNDANGKVLWYVAVTGTFTYTGSSSKCTSASVKAESYNQYWKISNRGSSYSGNKAKGKATGKLYYGPLPAATINKEVVLSCNSNGILS